MRVTHAARKRGSKEAFTGAWPGRAAPSVSLKTLCYNIIIRVSRRFSIISVGVAPWEHGTRDVRIASRRCSAPTPGTGGLFECLFSVTSNEDTETRPFGNWAVEGERTAAERSSLAFVALALAGAGYARRCRQ